MQYQITSNSVNFPAKALTRPPQDGWIVLFVGDIASKCRFLIFNTMWLVASLRVYLMDLGILLHSRCQTRQSPSASVKPVNLSYSGAM